MGLFQKRTQIGNSQPVYTISGQKTYLIIGLGNPGKEYESTRHNVGFTALDFIAKKNDFPAWVKKIDLKCELTTHNIGEARVFLCKPITYMNDSGLAAKKIQDYYKVYNRQTLVIYDDLAIEFGVIRSRVGGESAGHNGIKSLIEHIGEDFGRIRVGVGSEIAKKSDSAEFVLKPFGKKEQASLPLIFKEVNAVVGEFIFGDQLPHDTRKVVL